MLLKVLVVLGLIACGLLGVVLLVVVHHVFNALCVWHAGRLCERNGLEVSRFRSRPAFDSRGVKTEFTEVQLDCSDSQQQRRLVTLLVWPFGVRKTLSNEKYEAHCDNQWPESPEA